MTAVVTLLSFLALAYAVQHLPRFAFGDAGTELAEPTASDSEAYNISFVHAAREAERIRIWRLGDCWEPHQEDLFQSAELEEVY